MNSDERERDENSLTRGFFTKPSSPSERTVETIITNRSCPWNTSAVPMVTSLKSFLRHARAMNLHCNLYGVITPMSDCVIGFSLEIVPGVSNFFM